MSMTSSSIPDLLKIGSIPVNTSQDVETAVLEPVVHSDEFCRFVFQNKGILHSHSKIEIGLKNLNAKGSAIFPIGVGVYSLIERVALKMGTKTLCEIEDFAHYYAYKSLFTSNENMKERELYLTSRCLSHGPQYEDSTSNIGVGQGGGESDTMAPKIALDIGRDYNDARGWNDADQLAVNDGMNLAPFNFSNLEQEYSDKSGNAQPVRDGTSTFQLSLSELCPFLKMNQLPLYMIKEPVSLELTFSRPSGTDSSAVQSRRVVAWNDNWGGPDGASAPLAGADVIDTSKTRLIADYLYFPQEMMEAYAQANKNMSFTYVDYQLSKYSIATGSGSEDIRNIGGAGRIVSKIFWGIQNEFEEQEYLLNNYNSRAPTRDYTYPVGANDSNHSLTCNIKYNDNFLYPIDVSNSSRHFHNVQQTEGLVPFVCREEFSKEGRQLSSRKFCGIRQGGIDEGESGNYDARQDKETLPGRMFWSAGRLNKNERINSRGIELFFTHETDANISRTETSGTYVSPGYVQRVYLEVVRTATLTDGYFQCYYA